MRPRPARAITLRPMALEGLHHITAITADAPRNVDFYARALGLRLVKKTVNFDQPDVYHLYYGDELRFADPEGLEHELQLPAPCESRREQLERVLTPTTNPRAAA